MGRHVSMDSSCFKTNSEETAPQVKMKHGLPHTLLSSFQGWGEGAKQSIGRGVMNAGRTGVEKSETARRARKGFRAQVYWASHIGSPPSRLGLPVGQPPSFALHEGSWDEREFLSAFLWLPSDFFTLYPSLIGPMISFLAGWVQVFGSQHDPCCYGVMLWRLERGNVFPISGVMELQIHVCMPYRYMSPSHNYRPAARQITMLPLFWEQIAISQQQCILVWRQRNCDDVTDKGSVWIPQTD